MIKTLDKVGGLAPCHHLHSCHCCQPTQIFSTNCQHTGMTNIIHITHKQRKRKLDKKNLEKIPSDNLPWLFYPSNYFRHRKGGQGWMSSFITNYDELTPILNIYNDVRKTQVTQFRGMRKECIVCILIEKHSPSILNIIFRNKDFLL